MRPKIWVIVGMFVCGAATAAVAIDAPIPKYKPSSRSPMAVDIRSAAYGASRLAPDALSVGDIAPSFAVARAGDGQLTFPNRSNAGPTVLIFYRGHW